MLLLQTMKSAVVMAVLLALSVIRVCDGSGFFITKSKSSAHGILEHASREIQQPRVADLDVLGNKKPSTGCLTGVASELSNRAPLHTDGKSSSSLLSFDTQSIQSKTNDKVATAREQSSSTSSDASQGPMRPAFSAVDRLRLKDCATVWLRGGAETTAAATTTTTVGVAASKSEHRVGGDDEATSQNKNPWANVADSLKNGLASGLAAACVKTALQPFDTMKTVQQFSTSRISLLQAGRDLVARGGVGELYQGLAVTVVGSMPSVALYFGLYQFLRNHLDARDGISPFTSVAVSAGVGNFAASALRVPYEVVKQRLQVGAYASTMVALQSIYRQGGLPAFFGKSGLTMQLARDVPYAMVTLLLYETLQKVAARRKGPGQAKKSTPIENMIIGAVAGGVGSLVTNPMDMIKTRMATSPELYATPMEAVRVALRKEGAQAFMKGATPRLLHKIPANGFFFVAYEFFRNVLGVKR